MNREIKGWDYGVAHGKRGMREGRNTGSPCSPSQHWRNTCDVYTNIDIIESGTKMFFSLSEMSEEPSSLDNLLAVFCTRHFEFAVARAICHQSIQSSEII